jgi:hypothetical protein
LRQWRYLRQFRNTCVICDLEINSSDSSLLQWILSGEKVALEKLYQKLLILLSSQLCNIGLERLFFGLWAAESATPL